MTHFPSRSGAFLFFLAVSLGSAHAQTVDGASPAAAPVPVASVAPAAPGQPADNGLVHTDSKGRHLAPHGTFYLLAYVSARTDKGVEGFEPGAEVRFVEAHRATHTLVVSDGRAQVEVSPDKLTNDMDIAALVRQKDQNNQAQIAAYVQAELAASQKYEREAAEDTARDLEHKHQEKVAEANAEAQAREARRAEADTQNTVAASTGGYYNEGGYGYGSPYGFFDTGGTTVVTAPQSTTNANVGTGGNHAPAVARGGSGRIK